MSDQYDIMENSKLVCIECGWKGYIEDLIYHKERSVEIWSCPECKCKGNDCFEGIDDD